MFLQVEPGKIKEISQQPFFGGGLGMVDSEH